MIDLSWINPFIAFGVGILLAFNMRKVFARIQSRRGPLVWMPGAWHDINRTKVLQPLYDILKLLSKKTILPATATPFFTIGPIIALVFALALTLFVPVAGLAFDYSFSLVIIFYLLIGVTMCIIIGGTASASLFAAIGGVREIELMLANEIPFILGTFALAITYDTLSVQGMMGPNLLLNPFAAAAFFIAMLVKLHVRPFDIAEADSEIVGGLTTEYSGKLLGVLEITKVLMLFSLSALFVDLFLWVPKGWTLPGVASWALFLAGAFVVSVAIGIVNALFARFRIDQATKWLFTASTALGIIAIAWAVAWRFIL
ncbi:respiratory chain complex I subunit 1 family protein [Methanocella arvoryzae]|uniref:Hydrogenase membrane component (EchB-like) n=1 Tax=Methanocella arvoryzae (strain DSM 22066 / NBRC 105507 / MRE50) TaxID=351160 RepID=Q0W6T3_METAR|nr:complex I subunit 1 family protein [Methanocella arvoryzae]CAJ35910.1 putative hydrogenase membrane component (EchB-like) [Methanocella arvoryzae MRE50]